MAFAVTARRRPARTAETARRGVLTAVGAAAAVLFLLPLWWMTASALRPQEETFGTLSPVSVWTVLPRHLTAENFGRLGEAGFTLAMANSVLVAAVTVVVGLAICSMAAFALAVLDFPGRTAVFAVMVVSFLIPFDAIAIPLSSVFRDVGLQNTYAGLILPGIGNGLAVFLLRSFFLGIPQELAEAGRVDGLSWWGVFWRVHLPLSQPALIGAGLILFVFQWQSYMWPLLIAPDPAKKVAPVAIAQFAGEHGVDFGGIFAGAVVTTAAPLLVLLFFQRYFTQSLSASGLKG
ncbi:ABC transporter permease subunit [Auraticoccus sp. F435]|uniref:ABC transporter permease subunit n=1 Tax=Auraticoccus cholistanensis TaxID=2656650 RepID=A0A6A9UY77_9ACTN|nr:carbohydrate ABC transporter permease [Auraticoccus cholistanensis]MVA76664.1 ABC transporter permease subunit [Auraticoccus cholistanensis]